MNDVLLSGNGLILCLYCFIVIWSTVDINLHGETFFFSDEPRMRSGSFDDTGNVVGCMAGNPGSGISHHRFDQSQRPVSCEETWYSAGSDQELSSGDESEKSGHLISK
jgi:hypothetical protein